MEKLSFMAAAKHDRDVRASYASFDYFSRTGYFDKLSYTY
jgi:hypothetical protein